MLGKKTVIERVVESCRSAANHINFNKFGDIKVMVALLVPEGDRLTELSRKDAETFRGIAIVPGDLNDVLSRYAYASDAFAPDYVCRITGDCPLIPHFVISKHIVTAVKQRLDYVSNVHPDFRTEPDGYDCEVLSRALLEHTDRHAKDASDREHVTTFTRREMPLWAKQAQFIGYVDRCDMKYSVDTEEDYERVAKNSESVHMKILAAEAANVKVFRL